MPSEVVVNDNNPQVIVVADVNPSTIITDSEEINVFASNLVIKKVIFQVGDPNVPGPDDSSFTLRDANLTLLTNYDLDFFREGEYQYPDLDYKYDPKTAVVTLLHAPFEDRERVSIKALPIEVVQAFKMGNIGAVPGGGFPYGLPMILGGGGGVLGGGVDVGFPYGLPLTL